MKTIHRSLVLVCLITLASGCEYTKIYRSTAKGGKASEPSRTVPASKTDEATVEQGRDDETALPIATQGSPAEGGGSPANGPSGGDTAAHETEAGDEGVNAGGETENPGTGNTGSDVVTTNPSVTPPEATPFETNLSDVLAVFNPGDDRLDVVSRRHSTLSAWHWDPTEGPSVQAQEGTNFLGWANTGHQIDGIGGLRVSGRPAGIYNPWTKETWIFTVNSDGALYLSRRKPTEGLGPSAIKLWPENTLDPSSAPAVVLNAHIDYRTVEVFAKGQNGCLKVFRWQSGFQGGHWEDPIQFEDCKPIQGSITAVSNPDPARDRLVQAFALNRDGGLMEFYYDKTPIGEVTEACQLVCPLGSRDENGVCRKEQQKRESCSRDPWGNCPGIGASGIGCYEQADGRCVYNQFEMETVEVGKTCPFAESTENVVTFGPLPVACNPDGCMKKYNNIRPKGWRENTSQRGLVENGNRNAIGNFACEGTPTAVIHPSNGNTEVFCREKGSHYLIGISFNGTWSDESGRWHENRIFSAVRGAKIEGDPVAVVNGYPYMCSYYYNGGPAGVCGSAPWPGKLLPNGHIYVFAKGHHTEAEPELRDRILSWNEQDREWGDNGHFKRISDATITTSPTAVYNHKRASLEVLAQHGRDNGRLIACSFDNRDLPAPGAGQAGWGANGNCQEIGTGTPP